MHQRINHHRIGGVKPHIPHLAWNHCGPICATVQGPAQPIVCGHIYPVRIPRVNHQLIGRGAQVVEQIPGRTPIDRAVYGVVGNKVEGARC